MSTPRKSILSDMIQGISDRVAVRGGESLAFGPIHQEAGVTIIPVTEVRYIFGFGFGQGPKVNDTDDANGGGGGGGGNWSRPVGYIRIADGRVDFVPVIDVGLMVMLAAIVTGTMTLGFIRARRRSRQRWGR